MKRLLEFFLLMLTAGLLFLVPGERGERVSANQVQNEATFVDGFVAYEGTSFRFDKNLASGVRARVVEASLASAEEAAPYDAIYPRHIVFEPLGIYRGQPDSFIKADIYIYRLRDYVKAFAADERATGKVVATIKRLRQMLRTRSLPTESNIPTLPIPDGYLAFLAHTRFLRFTNGSGIVFLTQGQQDEMPINNQNLSYEFQGITNDGQFCVIAEFPVAAPFLAYDRDKANYDPAIKDVSCYDCPDHRRFMREYRAYVSRIKGQLEKLPAQEFQPSLKLFDDLLSSLSIRANAP